MSTAQKVIADYKANKAEYIDFAECANAYEYHEAMTNDDGTTYWFADGSIIDFDLKSRGYRVASDTVSDRLATGQD